jgi:hypothetical protein
VSGETFVGGGDQCNRSQGSGCTEAIRLIVHPVFYKFPLSPPDISTSYATREIQAARGGTLMGEKE